MVSENFYIAADVLMDHAQHASYYYPVLYATQATEDRVLILK